jgi:integrase
MASFAGAVWGWDAKARRALITARPVRAVHNLPAVSDIRALTAAMPERYARLALLCYCCGLRVSEASGLRLADIDLVANRLTVRVSKCSKGRTVPIPPEFVSDLRKQAEYALGLCQADLARGDVYAPQAATDWHIHQGRCLIAGNWPFFPQTHLAVNRWGKGWVRPPVHNSRIERVFDDARKATGILVHITPHRLRDAYAVHSLLAGVPINVIQQHMGHATLETTAKYLSFLLTPEGAKSFPGLNLFKGLQEAEPTKETA